MDQQTSSKEALRANSSLISAGVLHQKTVMLTLSSEVNAKDLHEALDRILRLHGCVACGLGGIDVLFRVQEEIINERFQEIQAVRDVTLLG